MARGLTTQHLCVSDPTPSPDERDSNLAEDKAGSAEVCKQRESAFGQHLFVSDPTPNPEERDSNLAERKAGSAEVCKKQESAFGQWADPHLASAQQL